MNRLKTDNTLFKRLSANPPDWWKMLIKDEEINIQIRKDNSIEVYYKGGAIIRSLKWSPRRKLFVGDINYQYIPLENERSYIPFVFDESSVEFGKVNIAKLDSFNKKSIKRIKSMLDKIYGKYSEKTIQANFIKNDPCFIDSEFMYNLRDRKMDDLRIDLTRLDTKAKKIVFIEVKTIEDRRLYSNEILEQLKKYKNFIMMYEEELLDYYKKVFEIKKNLGILPVGLQEENIEEYGLEKKPLLLFGDCSNKWIKINSESLDEKIKKHALGCYYFGKPEYSCEIVDKQRGNRHIF
jgi:hypothetical protein